MTYLDIDSGLAIVFAEDIPGTVQRNPVPGMIYEHSFVQTAIELTGICRGVEEALPNI
jgi:hypothetical protein